MNLAARLSAFMARFDVKRAGGVLLGWLLFTDALIGISQLSDAWPVWLARTLAGLCIVFLPGTALFTSLRLEPRPVLEKIIYCFGLSILLLIISGLAANQLLHGLGVRRPLELPGLLAAWNIMTLLCIVVAVRRWRTRRLLLRPLKAAPATAALVVAATLMPLIAAGGAFRLNNGGNALVAGLALCWAAGIIIWLYISHHRLNDATLVWCLSMIGLGVLFMTSLRSWDITGHDFPHEFRVYMLTHLQAHWDMSSFRDPYNACLSITILPEAFSRLLHVSGLVVFKVILQVVFAATLPVIYMLLRRFATGLVALSGGILFIAYPTFINDSAMLTRQGVAYLFFSLALLTGLYAKPRALHKKLFLCCALGVVLSHYSTSYMFVAIFAVALGCKMLLPLLRRRDLQTRHAFSVLSPGMVLALLCMTFLWYSQITGTSGGLAVTLRDTIKNTPRLLSEDNKSSDTSASLLLAAHPSATDAYANYIGQSAAKSGNFEPEFEPVLTNDDMAVTPLGKRLEHWGINPAFTATVRQYIAKILQPVTTLAVLYAAYRFVRRKPRVLSCDLVCLGLAGVAVVLSLVILPTLSLNYGILRAFQQALIYLVIPLTLLFAAIGRFIRPRYRRATAAVIVTTLFLLFTGVFAQLLGGVSAPLTMNNHGLYYGLYYTSQAELSGYAWLASHLSPRSDVRAASYAKALMHDPHYPFQALGVLPSQHPPGSYVFLGQSQVVAQKFYVYYNDTSLITTFPLDYYRQQNQLYSTASTGVFK